MDILKKAGELDIISKIAIVNLAAIGFYILLMCFVLPLIVQGSFSEEFILSFSTPQHRHLNLISFFLSVLFGSLVALALRKDIGQKEREIVKSVLSKQDKEVIEVIEEAKEITQDSLMFRLGWSRSKVSTIITNLEKRNLLQRKREGKTYILFLSKK